MPNPNVDSVLDHLLVAFGQGTGCLRVSRSALESFIGRYRQAITPQVVAEWETEAVQVLERIRGVGRLAAQAAVARGRTAIQGEDTVRSMLAVESESDTEFCPPQVDGDAVSPPLALAPEVVILAQVAVAFGQGTGAVRVSRNAVAALRERYGAVLNEGVVLQWDAVAVQALERIRAVGRLAAHLATGSARTAILRADVLRAALSVETESDTDLCPPRAAKGAHVPAELIDSASSLVRPLAVQ